MAYLILFRKWKIYVKIHQIEQVLKFFGHFFILGPKAPYYVTYSFGDRLLCDQLWARGFIAAHYATGVEHL